MKSAPLILLVLLSMFFFSCHNNVSKPVVVVQVSIKAGDTVYGPAVSAEGMDRPGQDCFQTEVPVNVRIRQLTEAAKNGDGHALKCLWDELLYRPDTITYYNPQLAYDVYKAAKSKKSDMLIDNESLKVATIKMCLEAGPLDWDAFLKKYDVEPAFEGNNGFSILEIAREASMGREFGKPDPHLVLQLICRGGDQGINLDPAIYIAYNNWKKNRVDTFEPLNFVYPEAYNGGGYHFFGGVRRVEGDADARWRAVQLAPQLKGDGCTRLEGALNAAVDFFEAKAKGEEGAGGSMFGEEVSGSVMDQRTQYLDLVSSVNSGKLPVPFNGDDSSDTRMRKAYNALITYLQKHTIMGMMALYADGVKEAQKNWNVYRDSTASMFAVINPQADEKHWHNWLAEVRSSQLADALRMAKEEIGAEGK